MRLSVFLLVSFLSLLGCQASPKKTVCDSTDWYELGRRNGTSGLNSQMDNERRRCVGHFDTTNEAIYLNGYNNGLAEYCSSDNGYSLGKAGATANKVCPRPTDEPFLAGYARGKKVRELERLNETLDRKISSVSQKLKMAKEKTTKPAEHNQLMSELSSLEQERQANQRRMGQIEKQIN